MIRILCWWSLLNWLRISLIFKIRREIEKTLIIEGCYSQEVMIKELNDLVDEEIQWLHKEREVIVRKNEAE